MDLIEFPSIASAGSIPYWMTNLFRYMLLMTLLSLPMIIHSLAHRMDQRITIRLKSFQESMPIIALSLLTVSLAQHLIEVRPWILGKDFFYYLCTARDLIEGTPWNHIGNAFYFPGAATFWKGFFYIFDIKLEGAQWAVVALIIANGLVISCLVARVCSGRLIGWYAGLLFLATATRLEGLEGTTELLVTFPMLIGIAIWNGDVFRAKTGIYKSMALGLALGLGVYGKQQGGLLALGWLVLIIERVLRRQNECDSIWALLLIPATAFTALIGLFLCEGDGLYPLISGLSMERSYDKHGDFLSNLFHSFMRAPQFWSLFGIALMYHLLSLFGISNGHDVPPRDIQNIQRRREANFLFLGAAVSLLQFEYRGYAHYALLTLAFAIPAIVIIAVTALRKHSVPLTLPKRIAFFFLLGLPFVDIVRSDWPDRFSIAMERPLRFDSEQRGAIMRIASDLSSHRSVFDNRIVVVEPFGINAIHFELGSRSLLGHYGWSKSAIPDPEEVIERSQGAPILLLTDLMRDSNRMRKYEAILHESGYAIAFDGVGWQIWLLPDSMPRGSGSELEVVVARDQDQKK